MSAPAGSGRIPQALFLDRDGTLIVDKVYLADPAGVELIPGAADALRRARALGYRLFLFTNQSGIGRGYHTLEDTQRVNARLEELLGLPRPGLRWHLHRARGARTSRPSIANRRRGSYSR